MSITVICIIITSIITSLMMLFVRQYQEVANRTVKSPVMQYGDLSIDSEECSKFEGTGGKNKTQNHFLSNTAAASGLPSRDVKLYFLRNQVSVLTSVLVLGSNLHYRNMYPALAPKPNAPSPPLPFKLRSHFARPSTEGTLHPIISQ
jgi:hypothetical protein